MSSSILVVDDHEAVRYTRARVLRKAGYEVMEAATGSAALALVAKHRPRLVILDVHLPDISGLDVCRAIKSDPVTSVIPVLHMSATSISPPEQVRGLEGGADGYLVEPIAPEVLVATVRAMVRMHKAEHEARKSKRVMDVLVGNLPGAAYQTESLGGPLTFVSNRVSEITGRSATEIIASSRGWWNFIEPDDLTGLVQKTAEALSAVSPMEYTYRVRWPDGSAKWVSDRVTPVLREDGTGVFWEGFATDVTERKLAQEVIAREHDRLESLVAERTEELRRSQERVRQSERLTAMGTLAAGLGHDMGNLLLPLRIRLDALKAMQLPAKASENILAINESCNYLGKLASGLKLLSADPMGANPTQAISVTEWLSETLPLLKSIMPQNVELIAQPPRQVYWVHIGKAALTQVVFNLVQNAAEAMRSGEAGSVRISVSDDVENMVAIIVADTGPGMSPEVQSRCFEPFFTTKHRGFSTGLGLALSYGIIRDVHGELLLASTLGKGTTFTISLRRAAPPSDIAGVSYEPKPVTLDIHNPRMLAIITEELTRMSIHINDSPVEQDSDALLLIVDRPEKAGPGPGPVLLLASAENAPSHVLVLGDKPDVKTIRQALHRLVAAKNPGSELCGGGA